MKKITVKMTAAFIAILTLLLPCGMFPAEAATKNYIMGDANGNGKIDSTDALMIQRYLVKQEKFDSTQKLLSDIDFDAKITTMDAMTVMRCVSGYSDDVVGANLSDAFEKEVVRLVNIERAKEGAGPLTIDEKACKAAAVRAEEIVTLFSHTRPNGTSWSTLLKEFNIKYKTAGENIASGYESPEEVVVGWMNSPGHRKNIMNKNFTRIGVGHYYNPEYYYEHYWEQFFVG